MGKLYITVAEAKELFIAILNNRKMTLDNFGFTPSDRLELEELSKIYRDSLNEYLEISQAVNKIK